MKNIIFIIFALIIGVAEAWGQTYLPNAGATLVNGTIYTATTKTINGTLTVPANGTVTIYIPSGITLTINGENGTNSENFSLGNPGKPAINVPVGSTLIITGEGTLVAKGGNGGNGTKGLTAHGGPGAAPAIGGIGGTPGGGWSYFTGADPNGQKGEDMGSVYILNNVHIEAFKGKQGDKDQLWWEGGKGGQKATYAIGGGGGGGGSKDGTNGANGDNGNLYIQNTATVNYYDYEGNPEDPTRSAYSVPPTKTGYTFHGYRIGNTWVFAPDGTIKTGVNSYSGNISEYWTTTVTFVKQGGSGGTEGITATYNSAMPTGEDITAPTRTGYVFSGYYYNPNGTGTKYYNGDMSSAHVWDVDTYPEDGFKLYAYWTEETHTINLDKQGGSGGTNSVTVTYGGTMPVATAPTREEYTFMGYFAEENGGGTQYYYPDMSSKNVWNDNTGLNTLYAYWADCHTDKTIKVSFDSNGAGYGTMKPQLIRLWDNIKENSFIKRDASQKQCEFTGWNTKADGTGVPYQPEDIIFATEEYSEITLYAQWGSPNDTYVISTAQELLNFASLVNEGSTSIKGILAGDIDMSGKTWIPIGTSSKPFKGVFDGNGYTVSNLIMADNNNYEYAGFFGYAKNATIKNVTVNKVTLYATNRIGYVCGGIAGDAGHTTGGILTRCGYFGVHNKTFKSGSSLAAGSITTTAANDLKKGNISYIWATATPLVGTWTGGGGQITPINGYTTGNYNGNNGELCFVLNDNVSGSTSWTQTFDVDRHPRPTNRGRAVYKEVVNNTTRYYNIYNVYYISNGGTSTACSDTEVKRYYNGGDIAMNSLTFPTTTRVGYTFLGWYTEREGGELASSSTSPITEDLILYAHWQINDYTLTYNVNGGNALSPASKEVTYNTAYGDLPTPTRTGYTFAGWFTEATGGTAVSSETIMGAGNVTIYAHWTANLYTAYLDKQDGSEETTPIIVLYDSAMPEATAPSRTGYTFGGYYSAQNGGGTPYYNADMSSAHNWDIDTDNSILYAKWTANQYTVSFDSKGGSPSPGDITVTYDAEYGTLPTPTRYGFTFDGWYTGETDGTQVESSTIVQITDDQTLYAHWNPITTDYDSYSVIGDPRLRGNYFRSFYDSHVAYELPDGVTAYKGQADGQYLVLTKIEVTDNNKNILPKDVPVILVAEPSYIDAKTEKGPEPTTGVSIKEISLTTSEYDVAYDGTTGNMLTGTDVDISVPDDSYLYYILSYGTVTKRLGFYKWPEGNTLSAHKAYVQQSPSSPARALIFHFEDDVTGINDAITDFKADNYNEAIYNLNGIRLSKPQKGINIINGKKIWVK